MEINNVSNTAFAGAINLKQVKNKRISDKINNVLSYRAWGTSARRRMENVSFDLDFMVKSNGKAIFPKIVVSSKYNTSDGKKKVVSKFWLNENIQENAHILRRHISRVQTKKENDNGYNTLGEKISLLFKKLFS